MPTWGLPVGDGQKRTRTSDMRQGYRQARTGFVSAPRPCTLTVTD